MERSQDHSSGFLLVAGAQLDLDQNDQSDWGGTFKIRCRSVPLECFLGENLGVSALAQKWLLFSHPSNMISWCIKVV